MSKSDTFIRKIRYQYMCLSTVFSLRTKLISTGMFDNRDRTTIEIQLKRYLDLTFLHAFMLELDLGVAMLVIEI